MNDDSYSNSSAWIDYDNDNDLDLFVVNANCYKFLYSNNGGGIFTLITSGSILTDYDNSRDSSWRDFDNDGYLDLFVANQNFSIGENNFLYNNKGDGTFVKITEGSIVTDGFAMPGIEGDYMELLLMYKVLMSYE